MNFIMTIISKISWQLYFQLFALIWIDNNSLLHYVNDFGFGSRIQTNRGEFKFLCRGYLEYSDSEYDILNARIYFYLDPASSSYCRQDKKLYSSNKLVITPYDTNYSLVVCSQEFFWNVNWKKPGQTIWKRQEQWKSTLSSLS